MHLNFKYWFENYKGLSALGLTAAAGLSAVTFSSKMQQEDDTESSIRVERVSDGRNFIIEFKNIQVPDESTGTKGRFLRKQYEIAKELVLNWLLDNEGIVFKTSGQQIRTAGTANLKFSNYEVDPDESKIIFIIHQKDTQDLGDDSSKKALIKYKKTIK